MFSGKCRISGIYRGIKLSPTYARLGSITYSELLIDMREMPFDGVYCDAQCFGDLFILLTMGHKVYNFSFTAR